MREIEVDTELLQKNISDIDDNITKVKTITADLISNVDELQGMWTGPAHDSFYKTFENDKLFMESVIEFLGKMLNEMQDSEDSYKTCESNVESVVTSLTV